MTAHLPADVAQRLDRAIARAPQESGTSPAAVLARLVLAEHDRLCDDTGPARSCTARASCREADDVLGQASVDAYSEYDDERVA